MVLSGLVSLVLFAAPQAGDRPGVAIGLVPIVRVTQPPVIDGRAEEAWSAAVKRRLERSKGPVPQSGDVQGSFRAMWDDAALYLFVEVLDDRVVRNQVNPWLDDSVEVYLDGDGLPRRHVRRPERPPVRLPLGRPVPPRDEGADRAGHPLRPGRVGARLPHGDRAAVVGDRRDPEARGRDRPRRPRQRQRRHGPRGQADVVGHDRPGPRRPAAPRAGDDAGDRVGRAGGRCRAHDDGDGPVRRSLSGAGAAAPAAVPRHPDRRRPA